MVETERLIFRKFVDDDLPLLIEQRADPDVNRYLGGPKRQNAEALSTRMKFYMDCYEKFGVGMCPMIWKETGEMIGTADESPERPHVDDDHDETLAISRAVREAHIAAM